MSLVIMVCTVYVTCMLHSADAQDKALVFQADAKTSLLSAMRQVTCSVSFTSPCMPGMSKTPYGSHLHQQKLICSDSSAVSYSSECAAAMPAVVQAIHCLYDSADLSVALTSGRTQNQI